MNPSPQYNEKAKAVLSVVQKKNGQKHEKVNSTARERIIHLYDRSILNKFKMLFKYKVGSPDDGMITGRQVLCINKMI